MIKQGIIIFLASAALAGAGASPARVSRYDIVAKGLRVGHVVTTRSHEVRDGRPFVRCEITTDVKVNLLVYHYALSSREVSWADESGLVEYELSKEEDGAHLEAKGALRDGVFHFDIVENGKARTLDIPRADYEFVTQEAPERLLQTPGESRTFRTLSVGTLDVVDRKYTLAKKETISVGGAKTECQVVDYLDIHKSGRRWFTMDDLGLCIVRQDGKDKGGRYSLRMTSNMYAPDPGPVATLR